MDALGEMLAKILGSIWFLIKVVALFLVSAIVFLFSPQVGVMLFVAGMFVLLVCLLLD
jgi:hypothetical protein